MSKRGRKRNQRDRPKRAAARSSGEQQSKTPSRAVVVGVTFATLTLIGVAVVARSFFGATDDSNGVAIVDPPDPDTSGFERFVKEKIRDRRAAVVADVRSAAAWGRLGMVFDVHNLVEEAVICYAQAARLDPTDFRWPYFQASCMPERDPADVVVALRRARSLNPNYVPLQIRLGRQLLSLGETDEAESHFQFALNADPNNSHALVGLAQVEFERREFDACRARLELARAARPEHGEIYRLLARVYRALKMPAQARAAAEQALRLPSKTPMSDPLQAEVQAEGATVKQLVLQASHLRRDQKFDQAVQKLRQALEVRPDNADAHLQLGLAYFFDLGRWDEGLPELREAVRLAPNHPHARRALKEAEQLVRESGSRP